MSDIYKFNPFTGTLDLVTDISGVGTGDVTGPGGSTDNAVARFNGTSGTSIQNSVVTIGDTGATVIAVTADVVALTLKSFAGQTVNVFEQRTSANALRLSTDVNGSITTLGDITFQNLRTNDFARIDFNSGAANPAFLIAGTNGTQDFRSMLEIMINKPTNRGLVIQGNVGQTANLQEFRDSSDTVLSYIDAAGNFLAGADGTLNIGDPTGNNFNVISSYVVRTNEVRAQTNSTLTLHTNDNTTNQLIVQTGTQQTPNNASGNILIASGVNEAISGTGVSGSLAIQSGDVANHTAVTGQVTIKSGNSSASATGDFLLSSGNGSTGSGEMGITTGTGNNTGNISLLSGNAVSNSGDILLQTGGGATSTGDILLVTSGSAGTRGKLKFQDGTQGTTGHIWTSTATDGTGSWQAAPAGGANTALSNLTTTAINQSLLPGTDLTFNLGSATATWSNIYVSVIRNSAGGAAIDVDSNNLVAAGQVKVDWSGTDTEVLTGEITSGVSGLILIKTGNSTTTGDSGPTTVSTGTTVSGTTGDLNLATGNSSGGNSGDINLSPGTAGGTRGKIYLVDGSEGTAGHVWTSTDTIGGGEWQAAGGGFATTELDNLTTTAINTDLVFGATVPGVLKTANSAIDSSESLLITSGNSTSPGDASGQVTIGSGTGDFSAGLTLQTGNASAGNSGNISIQTGAATGTRGTITLAADIITAAGNIVPNGAASYDLGASGAEWLNLYVDHIYSSGNCGAEIFDVVNGSFYDAGSTQVIDLFGRKLVDSSGADSIDWGSTSGQIQFLVNTFKVPTTTTAGGTTGAQTIDKMSGTVNFAAAASSLVVTNAYVSADSLVFAVVRTNDASAMLKNVVPAAGSFTINMNAAVTAETSVGFFVVNGQ